MASLTIPEGILLGIGNPLLDITVSAELELLKKYDLQANNAIIYGPRQEGLFEDMVNRYQPMYQAGGATQNSIRVAQWLLRKERATVFFGCVGADDRARILEDKAREAGVDVRYQINRNQPTGVCGSVITGQNRSLIARLGAADSFQHQWLQNPANWTLVEKARFYYIGGFVFPVCSQVIFDVAEHAAQMNKTLVMNLSAPFLCEYFANTTSDVMPYVDILFGNETEAATFCRLREIEVKDIKDMAIQASQLPKNNGKRGRIVVFTQGTDPTVVAVDGQVEEHPIVPVDKADVRDTNGCGDAFVGGFLSQLVQGKPIKDCLRCGFYASSVVIKHWGCNFPETPQFY